MKNGQHILTLDLEMNQPSNKIIEVGITYGDLSSDPSAWGTKSWLIDPQEKISDFIIDLTGITNDMIDENPSSLHDVFSWLQSRDDFECPVTWGDGDWRLLCSEFRQTGLDPRDLPYGRRHFDVKTIHTFVKMLRGQKVRGGLKSALNYWRIPFDGQAHRAGDDAFNTMVLLKKIYEYHQDVFNILQMAKDIQ